MQIGLDGMYWHSPPGRPGRGDFSPFLRVAVVTIGIGQAEWLAARMAVRLKDRLPSLDSRRALQETVGSRVGETKKRSLPHASLPIRALGQQIHDQAGPVKSNASLKAHIGIMSVAAGVPATVARAWFEVGDRLCESRR